MTDINVGAITEALNDKSDRDLRNVDNTAGADAVIEYQAPDPNNDYKWYRKYKSGWVEQGGIWTGSMSAGNGSDAYAYVTLPITMNDTNYIINITNNSGTGTATVWEMWMVQELTTSQFRMHMGAYANTRTITRMNWEVKGMAAS